MLARRLEGGEDPLECLRFGRRRGAIRLGQAAPHRLRLLDTLRVRLQRGLVRLIRGALRFASRLHIGVGGDVRTLFRFAPRLRGIYLGRSKFVERSQRLERLIFVGGERRQARGEQPFLRRFMVACFRGHCRLISDPASLERLQRRPAALVRPAGPVAPVFSLLAAALRSQDVRRDGRRKPLRESTPTDGARLAGVQLVGQRGGPIRALGLLVGGPRRSVDRLRRRKGVFQRLPPARFVAKLRIDRLHLRACVLERSARLRPSSPQIARVCTALAHLVAPLFRFA